MSPPRTDDPGDASTDDASDGGVPPGYPERGGIDVFDSLLLRQPIADGETAAVWELLAAWADDHRDGDVRTLLPVDGVTLVTLFLDDGGFGRTDGADRDPGRGDALLWYVEVVDADADAWRTPDATVRDASPLFEAGLADLLAGEPTVHAGGRDGHRYVTHVTNPRRRERYADVVGRSLVAPVVGDELPIPVAIVSLALRPGATSALVARAIDLVNWLKRFDRVQSWARDETDTVEAEAMYTESLLLETVGDRQVVHYYMETEDMDRLFEAFYESDDWEARLSERLFRRVLADPAAFLEPALETDCEVLIHAVDPERP
ncbi:hypothetical protein SAMN04488067_101225 [Halorubrum xinjiangense]|uniref:Uncharacterized protein n=1 Tax=Halorubrum xinjiangense TaxID=261291 RepID=A0A1G7H5Y2_9EURY|nr:hypothetical protein [Halorubrum xinjiangense]SDE95771.1 hypothetical protein SAMN04488067_101225 [Halorubrum xinjiangense]